MAAKKKDESKRQLVKSFAHLKKILAPDKDGGSTAREFFFQRGFVKQSLNIAYEEPGWWVEFSGADQTFNSDKEFLAAIPVKEAIKTKEFYSYGWHSYPR